MKVILSSSIIFEPGTFDVERLTLQEAREWVDKNNPHNYSSHDTVRVVGVEPSKYREACNTYDEALCIKPNHRLDFNRSYSGKEIEEIGVKCFLIRKIRG